MGRRGFQLGQTGGLVSAPSHPNWAKRGEAPDGVRQAGNHAFLHGKGITRLSHPYHLLYKWGLQRIGKITDYPTKLSVYFFIRVPSFVTVKTNWLNQAPMPITIPTSTRPLPASHAGASLTPAEKTR